MASVGAFELLWVLVIGLGALAPMMTLLVFLAGAAPPPARPLAPAPIPWIAPPPPEHVRPTPIAIVPARTVRERRG